MKKGFDSGKINFLGVAKYLVPISIAMVIFGLVEIAVDGFDYGIDFAGGTEIQVKFTGEISRDAIMKSVQEAGYEKVAVQRFGDENEYLVRLENFEGANEKETTALLNKMVTSVTSALQTSFASANPEIRRVDSVGPQVGDELKRNGLLACFYSLIIILIYIGLRFDYKYAPGAVFCLFHDAALTLALFAIFDREVNVQTLAAVLTLIGYSLNDTIVTFDRIRENESLFRGESFTGIINRSINDTLSRTILTAVTTLMACACLYFFADGVIRDIAFTLGVGIVIGTYSSIYIASPLVIAMDKLEQNRAAARMRAAKVG